MDARNGRSACEPLEAELAEARQLEQGTIRLTGRIRQDRVIALYRDELAKARSIKQGMMQELLTGRVRLPVDGARTVG